LKHDKIKLSQRRRERREKYRWFQKNKQLSFVFLAP
jgi:hypothetical protein